MLIEQLTIITKAAKSVMDEVNKLKSYHRKLIAENEKLQEYSDIYSNMEQGFVDWKTEIQSTDCAQAVTDDTVVNIVEKTVKESEKKWSDFFKTSKEEMKKQTAETKNQSKKLETAITAAKQKQAVDNIERQKRECNVSIRNIPESEDPEKDKSTASEMLDIEKSRIERVYRVGKVDPNKVKPRVLIAVLETPELAKTCHNFGRGRPIEILDKRYWINPDLIKTDREANYKARQLRLKLRQESQKTNNQ